MVKYYSIIFIRMWIVTTFVTFCLCIPTVSLRKIKNIGSSHTLNSIRSMRKSVKLECLASLNKAQ